MPRPTAELKSVASTLKGHKISMATLLSLVCPQQLYTATMPTKVQTAASSMSADELMSVRRTRSLRSGTQQQGEAFAPPQMRLLNAVSLIRR